MTSLRRVGFGLLAILIANSLSVAVTHRIDGTLPDGGDCPAFGSWNAVTNTCRIESALLHTQEWLLIVSATVEVAGILTNEGLLENRGTLVVSGFLNSTNDLVNSWDGTMVNRGNFFSHFMYNFGQFTNETTGTVEFELHLENNAPMTNHGYLYLVGNYINIPQRTLTNLGTLDIAPTGVLTNSGRLVHAGELNNLGTLQNDAELIEHCDSLFSGNPIEGQGSTGAQSLSVGKTSLEWCAIDGALGYDVVEGDLGLLRSSGGDFSVATTGCLGNDLPGLSLSHVSAPRSGQGLFFLVRFNGVASPGFDSVFDSQIGSRNAEIAASPSSCP